MSNPHSMHKAHSNLKSSLRKTINLASRATFISITAMAGFMMSAQAETNATSIEVTEPIHTLAIDYVASLPATSDPIENEARDFFIFLGEEKPEFIAAFIEAYGGALDNKFNDKTIVKRYVVLGAKDFILDHNEYFSVALFTDKQIDELNETLGAGSDQDKYDLYGKYIDETSDSSLWEESKRLDEEIEQLDEEGKRLDEEIAQLDEEIEQLDEEIEQLDEEIEQLDEEIEQLDEEIDELDETIYLLDETIYLLDKLNREADK